MAHTKAVGSTKLGRDSISKRLGVKRQNGEAVAAGQIIIRQRGTKYIPGTNVRRAGDDTLFAQVGGVVKYSSKMKMKFDGNRRRATVVSVASAK
jgi:large subunit ribosomal protein L27